VLVCLSDDSLNKRGYIQKEIKFALDAADEMPEGTIFIIPVRLTPCEVPDRLSAWQWVNLFDEYGYDRLARSLNSLSQCSTPDPAARTSLSADDQRKRPDMPRDNAKHGRDLFPLYEVVLGKTSLGQLAELNQAPTGMPTQKERYRYVTVRDVNFWYDELTKVANHIYIARGVYPIPERWQEMGFDWRKTYSEWCKLLADLGFSVSITRAPTKVRYNGHDSMSAEVTARGKSPGPITITLVFNYNEGNVSSLNTLYSIRVRAE
jgi:hypothetical protein